MINDFIFYSRVEYYQKSYFMSKALLSALDSIMHTFLGCQDQPMPYFAGSCGVGGGFQSSNISYKLT